MTKTIQCDCGYIARGDTDDQLAAAAQAHMREVHKMDVTRDQALAMARPA